MFRSNRHLGQKPGGWRGLGGGGGRQVEGGKGGVSQAITLKPSTHLEMEPQPVLGPKSVLSYIDVILQSVVQCACEANVAPLKVTAECEVA